MVWLSKVKNTQLEKEEAVRELTKKITDGQIQGDKLKSWEEFYSVNIKGLYLSYRTICHQWSKA